MSLYKQFINYSVNHGANMDNLLHETEEGYEFVSFVDTDSDGNIYNISLAFYDKEDVVEIYIRKKVFVSDELELFRYLNKYNLSYRGFTFIYVNGMVCLKSFCITGGDINIALKLLAKCMNAAKDVLGGLK